MQELKMIKKRKKIKTDRFEIRLSERDKVTIQQDADIVGAVSMSAYVIETLIERRVTVLKNVYQMKPSTNMATQSV